MLRNPNGKKLTYLLLGAAALVLVVGGGIVFVLNSQLTGLLSQAAQKETEVGSSEQIAKRYQTTLDDYTQTQSHIQYLETSVSAKAYVPTLLKQLQALAEQTHLTVTAVRPAAPPPPAAPVAPARGTDSAPASDASRRAAAPPPYDTLDIGVDVTGTYADTATFLYDLTRFPKIMSVASVQMRPSGPQPGASATASPEVTTNLHLTAFVFHSDDAAAQTTVASAPTAPTAAVAGPGASKQPTVIPAIASGTLGGAAGRATQGAVNASNVANQRSQAALSTM